MSWPPERSSPAPVVRPVTGRSVWIIWVQQNSRIQRGAQDHRRKARAKFAKDAVFSEFGRAGRALDQGNFADRKPWETPRPSPEVWRITRGRPAWP